MKENCTCTFQSFSCQPAKNTENLFSINLSAQYAECKVIHKKKTIINGKRMNIIYRYTETDSIFCPCPVRQTRSRFVFLTSKQQLNSGFFPQLLNSFESLIRCPESRSLHKKEHFIKPNPSCS